ncbi:PQQ-dependent sugar dehydrogenase [Paracoccus tegillarcae]|uniref:Glucose dehydrogenase n=1 Tax=Paracoccus tegillarcae TaxID=1529068 RepID=A0A2K9F5J1_9RHOB|nr:PQQ-dependent sugar dehydrogenase [Paracoccus tegillarcae]AUH34451.1 glucose dehydrogenase [Paracoccus tegillarcae]
MKTFIYTAAAALTATTLSAEPWPQGEPNTQFQPAFEGQTRADAVLSDLELQVEPLVEGLENPWALAFLPDGSVLITERPGRLKLYKDGAVNDVAGIPEVFSEGQGGLLDVAIAPDFNSSRTIFLSYAEPRGELNGTAVARMTLTEDGTAVENVEVLFQQQPGYGGAQHFGSRIVPTADGNLFVTLGERSDPEPRKLAQELDGHLGKVVRIGQQPGQTPENPLAQQGALPEIYAYGVRNPQGAALDADGQLWAIEHGPRGGDELNRIEAGKNYGWPAISYGINYSGEPISEGISARDGMEQPVYYWDPVIAPSGMIFYDGAMFPDWQGDVLIASLSRAMLVRLEMDGQRVTGEEQFPLDIGRVRDVQQAPDGSLWVVTDEADGGMYRVTPKS